MAGGNGYSPGLTSMCWGVLTAVGHRVAAGWVVVVERNKYIRKTHIRELCSTVAQFGENWDNAVELA